MIKIVKHCFIIVFILALNSSPKAYSVNNQNLLRLSVVTGAVLTSASTVAAAPAVPVALGLLGVGPAVASVPAAGLAYSALAGTAFLAGITYLSRVSGEGWQYMQGLLSPSPAAARAPADLPRAAAAEEAAFRDPQREAWDTLNPRDRMEVDRLGIHPTDYLRRRRQGDTLEDIVRQEAKAQETKQRRYNEFAQKKLAESRAPTSEEIAAHARAHSQSRKNANKMNQQIQRGRPGTRGIERVDKGDPSCGEKPHVHFQDKTSLNFDGSIHKKSNGAPNPTNDQKAWLKSWHWSTKVKESHINPAVGWHDIPNVKFPE